MQNNPETGHKDLLIRNVPMPIHNLLERTAKEHRRSKTQEALVALTNGLTVPTKNLRKPVPFQWKSKLTTRSIQKAIEEGRS